MAVAILLAFRQDAREGVLSIGCSRYKELYRTNSHRKYYDRSSSSSKASAPGLTSEEVILSTFVNFCPGQAAGGPAPLANRTTVTLDKLPNTLRMKDLHT
jgi:hypothetical protein